ncbi:MAG: hypothetical protein ACI92O_000007 [Colwellia sp.]|jgi:hypothetical protein|tara:strand:- start:8875 stop:9768 length:894 start_codon:yes stop_codon:yes gene_type:complete
MLKFKIIKFGMLFAKTFKVIKLKIKELGMNKNEIAGVESVSTRSNVILANIAKCWFAVAVIGQWIMVYYVIAHYGGELLAGNTDVLESPNGHQSGLIALIIHVIIAVVTMGFGPLQFIPKIREKFPKFHRINGRIYLVTIFIGSILGLYLVWGYEKMPGGNAMFVAMNIMVLLIITFAFLTLRYAIARNIVQHRQWALRLFMVVNSGWFFRVGLMAWLLIHQAPVGFDPETFEGPFIIALAFAQYLLPLALLELYFWAQQKTDLKVKYGVCIILILATLLMAVGIFGAAATMWLPKV